jgi:hypothetical protein
VNDPRFDEDKKLRTSEAPTGSNLAVLLPVILLRPSPDAPGHAPSGAEADYDRSLWRAEDEDLWVRAVKKVTEREELLTFWSECSPGGPLPRGLHDESPPCSLLRSIRRVGGGGLSAATLHRASTPSSSSATGTGGWRWRSLVS